MAQFRMVARAEQAFDSAGNLTDATARGLLQELLVALGQWIALVAPPGGPRPM